SNLDLSRTFSGLPGTHPFGPQTLDVGKLVGAQGCDGGRMFVVAALAGDVGPVAHHGGALLGNRVLTLGEVVGVATREHGRSGEFRLRHLVAVEATLYPNRITGVNPRPIEPPLVATEHHVRVRDPTNNGRNGTVTDVTTYSERLGGHDLAEGPC